VCYRQLGRNIIATLDTQRHYHAIEAILIAALVDLLMTLDPQHQASALASLRQALDLEMADRLQQQPAQRTEPTS